MFSDIVIEFENKVDKDKILEYYLNTIILAKKPTARDTLAPYTTLIK